jgi:hypothetical protein
VSYEKLGLIGIKLNASPRGHYTPHSLPLPDRPSDAAVEAGNDPYVEAISDHQFGTQHY